MTNTNQQPGLSKEQIDSVVKLYSNRQYQEAIDQIKSLNESYPNIPFLFNLIGACYKSLGHLEGAAKMFETAVSIKPEYAEAHKNLGITLRDLGQLDNAVESLNNAIAIDPNYVDAHYNLAITLKDLNHLDKAVKSYNKVIELNPNFVQAHNNLGNICSNKFFTNSITAIYQCITRKNTFDHALTNRSTLNLNLITTNRTTFFSTQYAGKNLSISNLDQILPAKCSSYLSSNR